MGNFESAQNLDLKTPVIKLLVVIDPSSTLLIFVAIMTISPKEGKSLSDGWRTLKALDIVSVGEFSKYGTLYYIGIVVNHITYSVSCN
jgi:hypothetical protein